jgi:ketosteroid isomerase-like protein
MNLITRHTLRIACAGIAGMLTACSGPTSDSRVADEAAIREADAASLRAIAAKQVDATVSYYDEQASILMPNAPTVTGREGIRKAWEQMFAMPGFNFAPKITKIEVARSGDLAYSQGTYEFTANDPQGRPINDHGKYVVVWKKQAGGAWKAVADIWNSDVPPASSAKQ